MMAETQQVDFELIDSVARLVFNQPRRHNAMSLSMWQQLHAHMIRITTGGHSYARVVVLSGAGDRSFVSGSDISEFTEKRSGDDAIKRYNRVAADAEKSVYDCPVPTIAAINGYCMGGGLGIAMGCDVRLCSDDAVFSLPAGRLGLGYEYDAVCKLFDILGPTATTQLFYGGDRFDAQGALKMGLVTEVMPKAELDVVVDNLSQKIASMAPLTLKAYKAALIEYRKPAAARDFAAISQLVDDCYRSDDYAEGQVAFREKRKPDFHGR